MGATSISSSPPGNRPVPDLIEESRRLVDASNKKGVLVRLLGGVAVYLQSPQEGPLLPRPINDIDLVTRRGARTAVTGVLVAAGYAPDEMFNALHGSRRLLFFDDANGRKLDVFVGEFAMCHQVPIADRLDREPLTVPLAELLMTKLQIVQLTERDQRDIYNLVFHHDVTASGSFTSSSKPVAWRTRSSVTPGCRLRTCMQRRISSQVWEITTISSGLLALPECHGGIFR